MRICGTHSVESLIFLVTILYSAVSAASSKATGAYRFNEQEDGAVTSQKPMYDKTQVSLALEVSIHIALAFMLAVACFLILRPFIPVITWGIIIAVAAYPAFRKLQLALGGRGVLSAILFTVLLLALLIVPVVLLAGPLSEGVQPLAAHVKEGTITVPPPPASVATWPIIGAPLTRVWALASR